VHGLEDFLGEFLGQAAVFAPHRDRGLEDGVGDLVGVEIDDAAVALDDLGNLELMRLAVYAAVV
jgi:hypothetical protein